MNSQGPQQHSITETAADWAVRLHAGPLGVAAQAELEQWKAQDIRHVEALLFAQQTWVALGDLSFEVEGAPVHRQRPQPPEPQPRRAPRRRVLRKVASVALLLVVASAGWLRGPEVLVQMQADYSTAKGEVRTVHLADGSTVALDASSAIRLEFNDTQRRVSLLAGSAIFDVAPRAGQETRPFVVESAGGQTRALGTRFVVTREERQQAWVGVLQHSVAVTLAQAPKTGTAERVLQEGQVARYDSRAGIVARDGVDLQRATSWQRGVLIFDHQPLGTVIDQLNRYRPGRVVLTNAALASREVSGVFRLDLLDAALVTLTQELQVQRLDLAGVSFIY